MHSRLAELVEHAEEARARLLEAVAVFTDDEMARHPEPEGWSVAQVLDHLARVEGGIARLLGKRLARAKEAGLPPETETGSLLGALDASLADPSRKMDAPEIVRPGSAAPAESLAALAASRAELLRVCREGDGLALGQVKGPHALLGELDFYQWVLMVAQHERRHTVQLERIASLLGKRGAEPR